MCADVRRVTAHLANRISDSSAQVWEPMSTLNDVASPWRTLCDWRKTTWAYVAERASPPFVTLWGEQGSRGARRNSEKWAGVWGWLSFQHGNFTDPVHAEHHGWVSSKNQFGNTSFCSHQDGHVATATSAKFLTLGSIFVESKSSAVMSQSC